MNDIVRLIAVIAFLIPQTGARAQAVQMSLEGLTTSSSEIVVGRAIQKTSYWNDAQTRIFTDVTIRVDESLKGDSGGEAVVTIPGGQVGNMLYEVSEMPVFVEGEDVLLFLWEHGTGKKLVYGGLQGKMEIYQDARTGAKMLRGAAVEEVLTLSKSGGVDLSISSEERSLENVLGKVRQYINNE